MKRVFVFCLFTIVMLVVSQEKPQKYWITFPSKDPLGFSKSSAPQEIARAIGISDRALQRRVKVSQQTLTMEDFPVSEFFLSQLKDRGVKIENTSRWFNAASAYLTSTQRDQIQSLPFVRFVEPVMTFRQKKLPNITEPLNKNNITTTDPDSQLYGRSIDHMKFINAIAVHKIGIKGRGVLVGMLDTGFRWKTHEALQNMNVMAEYDFIQKDNNTANDAAELINNPGQDSHGTGTMSLVGAYKEGQLVSPAYNASFILGKTEYLPTETNVEEDNWVAAIEWMESQGVDVVSSSLGYMVFDTGQKSYVYADMNGKTATTSKAAAIAARKGVVVVNAMGNEGANANPPSLTTPADADSIISVGAVSSNGTLAGFSSNGPTSDGRMKPDVMAHGVGTYWATPGSKSSYNGSSQGTSLATPLVAGTAAMILSAHPELTPIQVRDALRMTASNANTPNNSIGWGTINAYKAVLYNGMVMSTDPIITLTQDSNYSIGVFVVSNFVVKKDSILLYYTIDNGNSYTSLTMTLGEIIDAATNSGKYSAVIPKSLTTPKFYIRGVDATNISRTSPYSAPVQLYDAKSGTSGVPPGNPVPSEFALKQNFPNPFNPTTTISYDVPRLSIVTLTVYDMLGREVITLVDKIQSFGRYSVPFNGTGLASGVYCYRLQTSLTEGSQAGSFVETKRMVMVK